MLPPVILARVPEDLAQTPLGPAQCVVSGDAGEVRQRIPRALGGLLLEVARLEFGHKPPARDFRHQLVGEIQQVQHVGYRIVEHCARERPAQPVGFLEPVLG